MVGSNAIIRALISKGGRQECQSQKRQGNNGKQRLEEGRFEDDAWLALKGPESKECKYGVSLGDQRGEE